MTMVHNERKTTRKTKTKKIALSTMETAVMSEDMEVRSEGLPLLTLCRALFELPLLSGNSVRLTSDWLCGRSLSFV